MSEVTVLPDSLLNFTLWQDAVWFQNDMNPIAAVCRDGRYANVVVVGDVRIRIGDDIYKNVDDLIDHGIDTDEALTAAEHAGTIEFYNNNWFEIIDPALDDTTGIIEHTLHGAIEAAVDYLS